MSVGCSPVITSSSDEETLRCYGDNLKRETTSWTLAAFKGVLEAGKSGGFVSENTSYLNALKLIDTGLGQLLATIEARKDAYYEDWLVCVTSNHGGTPDLALWRQHRPGTGYFWHILLSSLYSYEMKGEIVWAAYFSKRGLGSSGRLYRLYGIGPNRQLAVEINMRNIPTAQQSYHGNNWDRFVGKGKWGVFRQREKVKIYISGGNALEREINAFNDARWHSFYTGLGPMSSGGRMYIMSYDGQRMLYDETQNMGVEDDSTALEVGHSGINFYAGTVRLWDTFLKDEEINEYMNYWVLPDEVSQRGHLIGEWRFSPDELKSDSIIPNKVKGMPDMIFKKKPVFVKMANTLPGKRSSGDLAMENILIAPQVIYWLCGADAVSSELDGHCFLSSYMMEEQWRDQ